MIRKDFLPLARPAISSAELETVSEVMRSGWLTTGPKVFEFEKAFGQYLNTRSPLSVTALNSCTSALFLALKVLGVEEGDEVILPTFTFAATAQVVEWIGAKPILCDIDSESLAIDPLQAESLITEKTRAIIPVHIAGFPCDLNALLKLKERYRLWLVEDAAHAVGTRYNGSKIGNFADITCFSFYATKNLAMGEGGAAVSRNSAWMDEIAQLAYFGINKAAYKRYDKAGTWAYDIETLGYKCNLDSIHAAIGLCQLQRLDEMNARRRQIAAHYKRELTDRITFSKDDDAHFHTFHLFPILLPAGTDRNDFIQQLKDCNIGSSVHFMPLHRHTHYKDRYSAASFPVADRIFERIVSIPMFPDMTDADTEYVITHINRILIR